MPDLRDDLAALRIDRQPDRPARRWIGWVALLIAVTAGGAAAWQWLTRERPLEVETVVVSERASGTGTSRPAGARRLPRRLRGSSSR
jgi:hypothetical protein